MDRADLIKNSAAYALMHRDAAENRISHAYLLVSADSETSDALCTLFLSECAVKPDGTPAPFSADVIRLPHGDKVLSSDVEELTDTVYFTPTELDKKFYVLDKGETMNEASQNKMLKVLEEPPPGVVIIIKCANPRALLPTVLSRVKRVDMDSFSDESLIGYLKSRYGEDGRVYLAAALSQGRLGLAEAVMTENKWQQLYSLALDTLKNMKTSRNILGFSVRIMAFKDDLAEFIDILELLLSDCMLASAGVRDRLKFKNGIKEIIDISAEYDYNVVLRVMPALRRAKARLAQNGNVQSALDELLFSLLEVKAKCRRL